MNILVKGGVFAVFLLLSMHSLAQKKDTLTNESIIQLTRIGLEPSVIITKMQTSATKFDVSTNGLVNLSNNKVNTAVISEMIRTASKTDVAASTQENSKDPAAMHRAGIYYYNASDADNPVRKVDAVVCNNQTTGGGYGGFGGSSSYAVASGNESKLKINDSQPVFYFYFNDNPHSSADWFTTSSPNEFALVKFVISKTGNRTFKVGSSSSNYVVNNHSSGIPENLKLPFEYNQVSEGIYKVSFPRSLAKGQYCFAFDTNTRKVFDFEITK